MAKAKTEPETGWRNSNTHEHGPLSSLDPKEHSVSLAMNHYLASRREGPTSQSPTFSPREGTVILLDLPPDTERRPSWGSSRVLSLAKTGAGNTHSVPPSARSPTSALARLRARSQKSPLTDKIQPEACNREKPGRKSFPLTSSGKAALSRRRRDGTGRPGVTESALPLYPGPASSAASLKARSTSTG